MCVLFGNNEFIALLKRVLESYLRPFPDFAFSTIQVQLGVSSFRIFLFLVLYWDAVIIPPTYPQLGLESNEKYEYYERV